jgi:hypothetical protein
MAWEIRGNLVSGHMTLYTSCLLICHVMRDQRKPCVGSHDPIYQLFTDMSRHERSEETLCWVTWPYVPAVYWYVTSWEIRGNLVLGHMTLCTSCLLICHVMRDQRKPCVRSHEPMYQLFTDMSRHGRSEETLCRVTWPYVPAVYWYVTSWEITGNLVSVLHFCSVIGGCFLLLTFIVCFHFFAVALKYA